MILIVFPHQKIIKKYRLAVSDNTDLDSVQCIKRPVNPFSSNSRFKGPVFRFSAFSDPNGAL